MEEDFTRISRRTPNTLYRVSQFFRALTARDLAPGEWDEVSSVLSPSQLMLFQRMTMGDQRHSLQVMQTLATKGNTDRKLLAAALLHDVGKSFYTLRLWERPVVVLIRHYRPGAAVRWGRQIEREPWGWKRPFVVYEQHPAWGASMTEAAGCSPLTIWLIRWHHGAPERHGTYERLESWQESPALHGQEKSQRELLLALRWADSEN